MGKGIVNIPFLYAIYNLGLDVYSIAFKSMCRSVLLTFHKDKLYQKEKYFPQYSVSQ